MSVIVSLLAGTTNNVVDLENMKSLSLKKLNISKKSCSKKND